jgi:hypothetical protein
MLRHLVLIAALVPTFAVAQVPGDDLRGLWADWRSVSSESRAAEARRSSVEDRTVAEARTLGERVGELVAAGDCEGGERMAREAGDFPLVDAVRNYCRNRAPTAS